MALFGHKLSRTGPTGSLLLSGLFIGALVTGVGYNALAASNPSLLDYYGPTAPGTPTAVSASPGPGQATVRWTRPLSDGGSPITGYDVTPSIGFTTLAVRHFDAISTTAVVTGLTSGRTIVFRVTARNAIGAGPRSLPSNAATIGAPSAPRSVTASPGQGQATVNWVVPLSANGAPIKWYSVTPISGGVPQHTRVFSSAATTRVITGLPSAKSFTFRVVATNANGTSPPSALSNAVVIGTPGRPTAVHADGVADGEIQVTFVKGPSNGALITKFAVSCTSANGGATKGKIGQSSPLVVVGLTVGKLYHCAVKATNSRGTGPLSTPSNAVIG